MARIGELSWIDAGILFDSTMPRTEREDREVNHRGEVGDAWRALSAAKKETERSIAMERLRELGAIDAAPYFSLKTGRK